MPPWLVELAMPPAPAPVPVRPIPRDGRDNGARALRWAYDKVAGAPEGQRNMTLNSIGYWVAGLAVDGVVVLQDAGAVLFAAAQHADLPVPEIRATLRSAFLAGAARPR